MRLESDVFGEDLEVRELDGREALNQLFDFEIHAVSREGVAIDVGEVVSKPVSIVFEVDDAMVDGVRKGEAAWREVRRIQGIVCECEDLLFADERAAYRVRVVPHLWLSLLVETVDIYMDLTVPQIIAEKLKRLGLIEKEDFRFDLYSSYPTREFVVQYKETDLAFISRLCEHYGIAFSFEHTEAHDVVVFTDTNESLGEITDGGLAPFVLRGQRLGVFELASSLRMVPRSFVERDYNYRSPGSDLTATAEMTDGFVGGIVEYGGHFKDEAEGKWLAEIRKQEHRARRKVFRGAGSDPRLGAGLRFELEGHPHGDVKLLVTEVHHHARQGTLHGGEAGADGYENEFSALSVKVPFRPARVTPRPYIHGLLNGVIDGTDDTYGAVDDQGRYLVRFIFDTSAPGERQASRPIRMMQPHSGAGYGMHFPLRVGTEVLIAFVGGDPDRPVIAGTIPNPQTDSPVKAENHTKNVIRTGGGNEIDIDDTDQEQRIKISTPRAEACLQLGSPNAPEDGAFLGTANNITTSAGALNNGLTSIQNMWSIFHDAWSNHVVDFAGAMTPMLKIQWFSSWAQGVASLTSSMLGSVLAVRDAIVGQKQVELDKQTAALEEAAGALAEAERAKQQLAEALEKCKTCPSRPKGDPNAVPPVPDPLEAYFEALEAYDAAVKKLEDDRAELAGLEEALDGAVAAGAAAKAVELEDETIPAQEKLIEDDKIAVDEAKAELDAEIAALAANPSAPTCSCDGVSFAERLNAFKTKNDALATARKDYATKSETASSLAEEIEQDGEKLKGVSDAQSGIDSVSGIASTASGAIISLITMLCGDGVQLYARETADFMLEEALRQYDGKNDQVELPENTWSPIPPFMKMVPQTYPPVGTPHKNKAHGVISRVGNWAEGIKKTTRMVPTSGAGILKATTNPAAAFLALTPILGPWLTKRYCSDAFNEARNIQGSENHAILFGKQSAFVSGDEHTTISSKKKVVVTADELALMHARGDAELAGGCAAMTGSDMVNITSRGDLYLNATGPKDGKSANTDAARWHPYADDVIRSALTLQRGTATLSSIKKNGLGALSTITLTPNDQNDVGTIEIKTGDKQYVKLEQKTPADTSTITVETSGSFKINAAKNGEIIVKEKLMLSVDGGPSIELTKDGITLTAGDGKLELKKTAATLSCGADSLLKAESAGVTMSKGGSNKVAATASGVEIKGAQVKHQ